MKRVLGFVLLLGVGRGPAPADSLRLEYDLVQPEVIQQRLEMVSRNLAERRATLQALFQQVGCEPPRLSTMIVPHSRQPDVICALGDATGTIVVGGHFDLVDRGIGAVDDWSGAALLPSLYQSLKSRPRRHRFVFIGFAGEEEGLFGSTAYVRKLTVEERRATRAMINLECLGMDAPRVWASRANKRLLADYSLASAVLHLPVSISNVENVGDDDSHPFLYAGIPVLTIHSVTNANLGVLHSSRDNLKAIHAEDYFNAYRLATVYLAYLDSELE